MLIEFNNCFIIQSPSFFSYFNHFLAAQGSDLPFFSQKLGSNYARVGLDGTTYEYTIICRRLHVFAGHVVVHSRPMEREKNASSDNKQLLDEVFVIFRIIKVKVYSLCQKPNILICNPF